MEKVVNKTVKTTLVGVNANAYALMGHFRQEARRQGWSKDEIESVINEAMTGDYDHLVSTLDNHCSEDEPDEDELDYFDTIDEEEDNG